MTCRSCGATIADKAIVCYRCGTATADPASLAPQRMPGAERHRPLWTWIVALVALALSVWLYPDFVRDRWYLLVWVVVLVVAVVVVWVRRSGRGRRLR